MAAKTKPGTKSNPQYLPDFSPAPAAFWDHLLQRGKHNRQELIERA
jgi:hypothetical protein